MNRTGIVKKILHLPLLLIGLLICSNSLAAQESYIGEIRIFAGNFAPEGWQFCNGQLMQISQNDALFALIGTTYGGDGMNTFALPDLRGRVPISIGQGAGLSNHYLGEMGGVEQVTLANNQMPTHSHSVLYNKAKGETADPTSAYPAKNSAGVNQYGDAAGQAGSASVSTAGGNQAHNNRQPYLACNYIIAMEGVFPNQSKDNELGANEYYYVGSDGKKVKKVRTKGSEPFISEISIFAFNFAPQGYAQCNGQLLPIAQNQPLYALLGTNFGGNGQVNFGLPDIRGRVPVHTGTGTGLSPRALGQMWGTENHTLTVNEIPQHSHLLQGSSTKGISNTPQSNILALDSAGIPAYTGLNSGDVNSNMLQNSGGSQPHLNLKPYTALNFCIALQGIWPSMPKDGTDNQAKGMDPFIAEIAIMPINYAPMGYARCDGQLFTVQQNTALFSLVGVTYGGNGQTNFNLPDLRGRVPVHVGGSFGQGPGLSIYQLGEKNGTETVTLTAAQMPMHNHLLVAATTSTSDSPAGKTFGIFAGGYTSLAPNVAFNSQILSATGGNQPHNNMMPSIGLNYYIATNGVYPPRPYVKNNEKTVTETGVSK